MFLYDAETKKPVQQAVHIDRLKPAYIRQQVPRNFFKVLTKEPKRVQINISTQTESVQTTTEHKSVTEVISPIPDNISISRPKRVIRKPKRFCDTDHIDPNDVNYLSVSSDSVGYHKIKRVLAQRNTTDGLQYLVHVVGEPAQNAVWVSPSNLNVKAKQSIQHKPPPLV